MPTDTWRNLPSDKRNRILEAGMREFGERGYVAGSLNVIARDAGVSKGSLFQYFEDKFDFYFTVCGVVSDDVRAAALQDIDVDDDQRYFDRLRRIVHRWLDYYRKHPLERSVTIVAAAELDRTARATVRRVGNEHFTSALRPLIAQAEQRGELAEGTDLDVVLSMSVLVLRHLASAPFDGHIDPVMGFLDRADDEVERIALDYVDVLDRGFSAP